MNLPLSRWKRGKERERDLDGHNDTFSLLFFPGWAFPGFEMLNPSRVLCLAGPWSLHSFLTTLLWVQGPSGPSSEHRQHCASEPWSVSHVPASGLQCWWEGCGVRGGKVIPRTKGEGLCLVSVIVSGIGEGDRCSKAAQPPLQIPAR